jgi:hypothetical protein
MLQQAHLRMVRDVFHVSGLLRFDAFGSVVEIVLNQEAFLRVRKPLRYREKLSLLKNLQ